MHIVWFSYSSQKIPCLIIVVELYFWYFIGMLSCIVSASLWLNVCFILWCHIDVIGFGWTSIFTGWFKPIYLHVFVYHIFGHAQICTDDHINSNYFSTKKEFFLFPCSLSRIADVINKSTHSASRLMVIS